MSCEQKSSSPILHPPLRWDDRRNEDDREIRCFFLYTGSAQNEGQVKRESAKIKLC